MQPIYKPGFSVENKNKILSESDNGTAKHVIVTAICNSNKANVMIKNIKKDSKTKRMKIIFTLKPKHLSEDVNISEESFENLLKKLAHMNHAEFVAENFGVGDNA